MTLRLSTRTQRLIVPLAMPALVAGLAAPMSVAQSTQTSSSFAAKFADAAFYNVWERTDALVASSDAKRTWFWGPEPNSKGLYEEYKEGKSGRRIVQYFDKSRMEINNPEGDKKNPFYVTNGLLTVELISGQMQTGNDSFVKRQPSQMNVTGDPGDTLSPSYAELAGVSNALGDKRDPDRTGKAVTATLDKDGKVGNDPAKAEMAGAKVAYYEKTTGHNIPQVMWDFLNSSGALKLNGSSVEGRLIEPWFYASGLPISDAYWVRATIKGKPADVLVQAYERRVLTYVPTNPAGFRVEMGNIGQHYYDWRYANGATPVVAPTPTAPPPPPPAPPLSRYTVDVNSDLSADTLNKIRDAGAGGVRLFVSWRTLEPENVGPSGYNWSAYDDKFKALADRGLQPIVLIDDCPAWACSRTAGPIRAERVEDFVQFMGAVVERYSKAPYHAVYYEFWNEPDATSSSGGINYNWGRYGARYAAMLKAVRPAMKAANPNVKLVLGGIAYDNFTVDGGPFYKGFLDEVLGAGGGQALDVFNFHYYVQNVHWCSFRDKLEELRGKLRAHGLASIPIMSTETGLTSATEYSSSEERQATYLAQAYAQTAGEKMITTSWFLAKDATTDNPGWKVFANSGLLSITGAPKPAYSVYRASSNLIGDRPAVRRLGEADGLSGRMRGYEFGSDSDHSTRLWVVWSWDLNLNAAECGAAPATRNFVIPGEAAPRVKRVLDLLGQSVQTTRGSGGSILVPLNAKPVYIEWER